MSEPAKLSRRDWFRLRIPRQENLLDQGNPVVKQGSLKPIEHPPNHDGLDLTELPPMLEGQLTRAEVTSLFSDIGNLASEILLMQRNSNRPRADGSRAQSSAELDVAGAALLSGAIGRIQIRYRWQDSLWIDTLEARDGGFRIVRIAHKSSCS